MLCGSALKSAKSAKKCYVVSVAYFNDVVVGAVCCRVETEGDQKKIYIMTLGVLAPYRQLGIGEMLLYHS